jgi:uncharacterized membrane protein HdeD (DUF308 family)
VAVIWWFVVKQRSRRWFVHLVLPGVGLLILLAVIYNARASAQILGVIWLAVGIVLAIILRKRGRMTDPSAAGTESTDTVEATGR